MTKNKNLPAHEREVAVAKLGWRDTCRDSQKALLGSSWVNPKLVTEFLVKKVYFWLLYKTDIKPSNIINFIPIESICAVLETHSLIH